MVNMSTKYSPYKKALAVVMAVVMVFSIAIPGFAAYGDGMGNNDSVYIDEVTANNLPTTEMQTTSPTALASEYIPIMPFNMTAAQLTTALMANIGGTFTTTDNVVLDSHVAVPGNTTLEIASGHTLTLNAGGSLDHSAVNAAITNNGMIVNNSSFAGGSISGSGSSGLFINNGTFNNNGTFITDADVVNNGSIQNNGTISISGTITGTGPILGNPVPGRSSGNVILMNDTSPPASGTGWTFNPATNRYTVTGDVTIRGDNGTSNRTILVSGNPTLTLDGVTVTVSTIGIHGPPVETGIGNVTINLATGTTNSFATTTGHPGIQVGSTQNLTINGLGTLVATSSGNGAGIGFQGANNFGHITINSGTVIATGGPTGPGFGNASITINGGNVTANGGGGQPGFRVTGGNIVIDPAATINSTPRPQVTFDSDGGTTVSPQDVGVGNRFATLPTSTRGTDTLAGWFTAPTGGTQITAGASGTVFTNNATVYAQWTTASPITGQITASPPSPPWNTIDESGNITRNITVTLPGRVGTTATVTASASGTGISGSATLAASDSGTTVIVPVTVPGTRAADLPVTLTLTGGADSTANTAWNTVTITVPQTAPAGLQPGAAVQTPATQASVTYNSITVNAATLAPTTGQTIQYAISIDGTTAPATGWQAGLTFTGLNPTTTYFVWARSALSSTHYAGVAMPSAGITTLAAPVVIPTMTLTPTSVAINDNNLSATVNVGGTATGAVTLDTSALPSGVTANVSGNSITVTGTRPTTNVAAITGGFNVQVTRQGITQAFVVNVNLSTTWTAPPVYTPSEPDNDPGPDYGWLSPSSVNFDLASPRDVTITFNRGDFTFQNAIWLGNLNTGTQLVRDRDFTVENTASWQSSNRVTLSADFLSTLEVGTRTLRFVMSGNRTLSLTVRVTDTRPTATPAPDPTPDEAPALPTVYVDLSPTLQAELMELLGDRFDDLDISVSTSRASDINGGILLVDVAFGIDSDTANAEALSYTLNNQLPQIFQNPNAYYSIRVDLHGLVAAGMNYHRITAFVVVEADADAVEDEQQDEPAQAPPLAQPYEIGTLIGGSISRQGANQPSMPFAVNASATGEFVIAHVGSLNRLTLSLDSYTIADLAGNAPTQTMDVRPVIQNDRTLIPIRFIGEALGADIDWTNATENSPAFAHITFDGRTLDIPIGEITPQLAALGMDVPAQLMNSRTMIPLRFVSEFFGAVVEWDNDTRSIEIISIGALPPASTSPNSQLSTFNSPFYSDRSAIVAIGRASRGLHPDPYSDPNRLLTLEELDAFEL